MSELKNSKVRAEITVLCIKNRKVATFSGRYGFFYEAYALCASKGYRLLTYKAIC